MFSCCNLDGPKEANASYFILYFFLNLSTRPVVSTSLDFPVKNGWQLEQISTLMSPEVERVSITVPQAHLILAATYFGWMSVFMVALLVRIHAGEELVVCLRATHFFNQ